MNNRRSSIFSMNYFPLPLLCLSTTSYESKQKNFYRPGKEEIVIFDEQDQNHYYFDTRRHKKRVENPFSCVEQKIRKIGNSPSPRSICSSFHLSRPCPVSFLFCRPVVQYQKWGTSNEFRTSRKNSINKASKGIKIIFGSYIT